MTLRYSFEWKIKPQASHKSYFRNFFLSALDKRGSRRYIWPRNYLVLRFFSFCHAWAPAIFACIKIWSKEFEDYTDGCLFLILSKTIQMYSRRTYDYFYSDVIWWKGKSSEMLWLLSGTDLSMGIVGGCLGPQHFRWPNKWRKPWIIINWIIINCFETLM